MVSGVFVRALGGDSSQPSMAKPGQNSLKANKWYRRAALKNAVLCYRVVYPSVSKATVARHEAVVA